MNTRFVLSTAGVSAAAIGASATADVVNVRFNMAKYPSEAEWFILDASSNLIATEDAYAGVVSSDSRYLSSSYGAYASGGGASEGVWTGVNMDLGAGVYTVIMTDSYGDGWNDLQWGGITDGSMAFSGPYGSNIAFTSGSSTSGTFTVVPAPGAVSLLALAGVAGLKRRRK